MTDRKPHVWVSADIIHGYLLEVGPQHLDDIALIADIDISTAYRKLDGLRHRGRVKKVGALWQAIEVPTMPDMDTTNAITHHTVDGLVLAYKGASVTDPYPTALAILGLFRTFALKHEGGIGAGTESQLITDLGLLIDGHTKRMDEASLPLVQPAPIEDGADNPSESGLRL